MERGVQDRIDFQWVQLCTEIDSAICAYHGERRLYGLWAEACLYPYAGYSRPLLGFLDDAMAVRRAAEQQDRYYGHIAIDRHLTLSAPEVARLLSVREGRGVQLVLNTWFSGQPASVPVDGGEPDFLMRIARRDFRHDGGLSA